MIRTFAASLLFLPLLAAASVTEIVAPFANQTSTLSASTIMSAGDGNYFIAAGLSSSGGSNSLGMILRWTDPNGFAQSQASVSTGSDTANLTAFISIENGTQPTIETSRPNASRI